MGRGSAWLDTGSPKNYYLPRNLFQLLKIDRD